MHYTHDISQPPPPIDSTAEYVKISATQSHTGHRSTNVFTVFIKTRLRLPKGFLVCRRFHLVKIVPLMCQSCFGDITTTAFMLGTD